MTTSPIKARVPFPPFFNGDGSPLDTYYAQILANNALHKADMRAQVRVNWSPPNGANTSYRREYLAPRNTPLLAINTWYPIVTFGPFPVSMTTAGAYSMRVRIAGQLSTAGTGKIGAVWSAQGTAAAELDLEGDNTVIMDLTSTTSAWKTGAVEVLTLTDAQIADAVSPQATPIDFGGDPSSVAVVMTTISVYGQATNTGVTPRLTALYAAELAL